MTDPIADMLTRIRNALRAGHPEVSVPLSRMKLQIARVLRDEGYIEDYQVVGEGVHRDLRLKLKYQGRQPVIRELVRVSKPGRRVYVGREEIPRVRGGLGVAILSTPRGVLSDKEARQQGVGGELLCTVW